MSQEIQKKLTPDQERFTFQEKWLETRQELGKVILACFEQTFKKHGISFDPDTCYEAAEAVMWRMMRKIL